MDEASAHSVNTYWATMFGCRIDELRPGHGRAFARAGFSGYEGAYAMMFGEAAPIVSVPVEVLRTAQDIAREWLPNSIRRTEQLSDILGKEADRVIGPAALLYADASTLRATPTGDLVRQLARESETDQALVRVLRTACTDADWETGGSDMTHDVVVGAFVGPSLGALAGYEVWGDRIAHLAIVSHPEWRGRGLATAAVVKAASLALAHGLVLQYRSLESNAASLRIAHALGFAPFATSLAVRSLARDV